MAEDLNYARRRFLGAAAVTFAAAQTALTTLAQAQAGNPRVPPIIRDP